MDENETFIPEKPDTATPATTAAPAEEESALSTEGTVTESADNPDAVISDDAPADETPAAEAPADEAYAAEAPADEAPAADAAPAEAIADTAIAVTAGNGIVVPTVCPQCGAPLAEGQLFCDKCGFKIGADLGVNDKIEAFNAESAAKKAGKKKKLTLILIIAAAVLVIGGICSYFFYFKPNSRFKEGVRLYDAGEYEQALEIFEDLGGFKNSEERAEWTRTAILEEKYNEALKLAGNSNYSGAIALLTELGDYKDSAEQIEKIKADYFEKAQIVYNALYVCWNSCSSLADGVSNTIRIADLYDSLIGGASVYTAVSRLYAGEGYSKYYYGYIDIVDDDLAEAFYNLLSSINEYFDNVAGSMGELANPPVEYEEICNGLKKTYSAVKDYLAFINEKPSTTYYTTYDSANNKVKNPAEAELKAVLKLDPKIDDLVDYD